MVTIDTKEIDNFFLKTIYILKNPVKYLHTAFNVFGFRDVIDHFRRAEGPEGSWPKRKDNRTHPLLQNTGNLRNGFLPSNIRDIDVATIEFFNPVSYGGFHNWGTKYIPKREFMWLTDETQEKMADYILDKMVES